MYAYIQGIVADLYPDRVVLDVGHIGYNIIISQSTANKLPPIGGEVRLYTYTSVREDAIELMGFLDKDDLAMFKDLISVSGIGPKSALNLLSVMDANSVRIAIITGDSKSLAKAPGLGKKSAERLIVDLKGKYDSGSMIKVTASQDTSDLPDNMMNARVSEAADVLGALGFNTTEAVSAIRSLELTEDMDVDDIIAEALKVIR
ncbi:MAG: Holliday junction branch migration protein RuvA [Lachnospiraceae bacterium]|nr:Holliday junction branch migration protein RuvA [Lachnospiraceae bacterium]